MQVTQLNVVIGRPREFQLEFRITRIEWIQDLGKKQQQQRHSICAMMDGVLQYGSEPFHLPYTFFKLSRTSTSIHTMYKLQVHV